MNYLFILLLFCLLLQLLYWGFSVVYLSKRDLVQSKGSTDCATIVIVFKNELKNLKDQIPLLLNQKNIEFELLLVDDNSNDGSSEWIQTIKDKRIKLYKLKGEEGKKRGVDLAFKHVSTENVLLTDADCIPMSTNWAFKMLSSLNDKKQVVLGYSRLSYSPGTLNLIQRFENFIIGIQYLSFAKAGMGYMATGRNLAYNKSIREGLKFSEDYYKIKSGDDDLLINSIVNKNTIGIQFSKESQTISEAATSWKEYFFQKRRHLQAGIYYRTRDRLILAFIGSSQLLFNILIVILFAFDYSTTYLISLFVSKSVFQSVFYYMHSKNLSEKGLWFWVWILEPVYLIIISIIGLSIWMKKVDRWK